MASIPEVTPPAFRLMGSLSWVAAVSGRWTKKTNQESWKHMDFRAWTEGDVYSNKVVLDRPKIVQREAPTFRTPTACACMCNMIKVCIVLKCFSQSIIPRKITVEML
jgi:hypothetical protein